MKYVIYFSFQVDDLSSLVINEHPILLHCQLKFEIRSASRVATWGTTRWADETVQSSTGYTSQRWTAGRCRRRGRITVTVFGIGKTANKSWRIVADSRIDHLIAFHSGHYVLLKVFHCHWGNIPQFLKQFVRFRWILVHHNFSQDPIAFIKYLKKNVILAGPLTRFVVYNFTFPGMKQKTPSTVYL